MRRQAGAQSTIPARPPLSSNAREPFVAWAQSVSCDHRRRAAYRESVYMGREASARDGKGLPIFVRRDSPVAVADLPRFGRHRGF
jgi:hypothetical protein